RQWQGAGTLSMGRTAIPCRFDADTIWLGFPAMAVQPCPVPTWANELLGTAPNGCALAGGDSGYLVLEMAPGTALESLPRPGDALAQHTTRALVITCRASGDAARARENIRLRYFAPQYGVAEDAATGSAMRVLAPYWQQAGLGPTLTALQSSAQGGLLHSRVAEGTTWIGGRVDMDGTTEPADA
ncbi:MAG: PhzF family phenazine biosynthesis protein, partial [Halioglobus sp.]|nr:PhzF family phenazine biosynthesis protein [Halioglobus sp.]